MGTAVAQGCLPPPAEVLARRKMGAHVVSCAVEHIDAYITLGTTRLGPHLHSMRAKLAEALLLPLDRVSVKARTNDGLGPDGEGRAASATSVVLLCERSVPETT